MDLRSGTAFWPARSGLIHTYPPISRNEEADVVVIGAGVTGALVSYRLAAAGANVVVLDKRDVASGSTAATSGLLMYETDTTLGELIETIGEADAVRTWRLGLEAIDAVGRLCDELDGPCGYERRDALYLASSRRDGRRLAAEYDIRRRHGFDVDWLAMSDIDGRYGIKASGAIFGRGSAQIDAFRFTHRVLHRAAAMGVRIYDRTEAVTVTPDDHGVVVKTNRGSDVRARHVVWAAGYEGVEETQTRVGRMYSTWVVVSEPCALGAWSDRVLIWETARPYLYARVTDDGRVLVGGEDERWSHRHTSARRMARKSKRLVERIETLFPDLEFEPSYEWAGAFSTTSDGLPFIGTVPEHPHAWLALGYGGNGITFSMIAASLICDAWQGIANEDARLFSFDR